MKRNIVTILLLLAALPVAAWQYTSLSGQYRIAGQILAFLIQSIPTLPASSTYPEVSDYACLVKNSMQVYHEVHEQWQ